MNNLNIRAMVVSLVSNMVIGALWYSPLLFGNIWLKLIGKTQEDISKKEGNAAMSLSLIPAILSIFLLWFLLRSVGADSVTDALIYGSLASLGFVGINSANLIIFEGRPVGLTMINVGYNVVSWNVAAIILTLWK